MTRMAVTRRGFAFGVVVIGTVLLNAGLVGRALNVRTVNMQDACDDVSFNAAFGDGICIDGLGGGVTVDTFLQVLENSQKMGAWHFAPGKVNLRDGQAVQAYNSGGEQHTFTEVAEFGGGFITELNDLVGAGDTVDECDLFGGAPIEFINPGDTSDPEVESPGTHKYMCCIHPWMRATVTVR